MDLTSASAQNIVLISLAIDKDSLFKQELERATNLESFMEITKTHGYDIDSVKLQYMNLFFEQESEAMSRLSRVMNIIGYEKFEPGSAEKLARDMRLMQNWINLTSRFFPNKEQSLPRREIQLPGRIGQNLDEKTRVLLRSEGVLFSSNSEYRIDHLTLKKLGLYFFFFAAGIFLFAGSFLNAIVCGSIAIWLLNAE